MEPNDFELMRKLGIGLDASVRDRHLPNPALACQNPNETDSSAYIRAIRARLIELGYLGEGGQRSNRNKAVLDSILVKKIRKFQKEAGIEEDGWAGKVTWQVLECLVSFENQQSPAQWRLLWHAPTALLSNKAVLRAVYCRLYALGFFADWQQHHIHTQTLVTPNDNPAFQQAIEQFCLFAKQLGVVAPSCTGLSLELLSAMFEYDKIVASLSHQERFYKVNGAFQKNIDAIARIELWLLGYDVAPGQDKTQWRSIRRGKNRIRVKVSLTRDAIKQFYSDYPLVNDKVQSNKAVTPSLMAAFTILSTDTEVDEKENESLNASVSRLWERPSNRAVVSDQFAKLANGIFDGIKRVIRWLVGAVKRAAKLTKAFITNIVRYISKNARKSFLGVVKAFDIVYSGMSYLKNTVYQYSTPTTLYFAHDKDFDQYCCIAPGAPLDVIKADTANYRLRAQTYAAGLNIVSHLLRIAQRVVRTVSSPVGWLLAMLSLSNLSTSIKEISYQIKLIERYELNIAHQKALFKTRIS